MHEAPAASQRRHWYANVMGVVPDQLPFVVVRVLPACAEPESAGRDVLTGGAGGGAPVVTVSLGAFDAPASLLHAFA